jgi:hypothetical protein
MKRGGLEPGAKIPGIRADKTDKSSRHVEPTLSLAEPEGQTRLEQFGRRRLKPAEWFAEFDTVSD